MEQSSASQKEGGVRAATEPFTISRTFDAPRSLVWKAWTEPDRMIQWWGPKGSTIKSVKMDMRPGGINHYCMSFMGNEMWGRMVYREISPESRMVWINSFSDPEGGIGRHPMNPNWPEQMLTTLTLDEKDGKTTVSIEWIPLDATRTEIDTFDAGRASMNGGWSGTFDQLAEYLARA